jgi:hypothetical protein
VPSAEAVTGRRWTEARLSSVERTWAPRAVIVDDGMERGMRLIELRGLDGLEVDVEPDQFLDLGRATFRGEPLSFTAAGTSRLAESWGRRWRGGLLTTCGLEAVGQAPPEQGGVHGRAHLIAAQVTASGGRWDGDAYEVRVEGTMREAALFAPNLSVRRTISGTIGSSVVRIHDEVRNDGFIPAPLRLLYHVNVGWPWLEAGATVAAGDGWSATIDAPEAGAEERVDALDAVADATGWASAELAGPRGRFAVAFRPEQLPFVTIWRSIAAGHYALGLEPGTCWPSHAEGPARGKTGIELAPGRTHEIDLALTVEPR